ncbi:hypothetical protein [Tenacibaculum finnmarkense]|uniref:Uncharacterized protein n=1 Tax=Tenacibaculum finnmarkense genomovar finnmarkense TaxID=1458503 RepID=A0AAP1RFU8_9FLAO|nr:hypothetical protein [Tenacibaculum finnmarkense]MBE7653263.1 hypothetical protein [Tenacibaculum finnmarkense genomovar finnmarkense]MBE7695564.1 hypothetical protein [Tenacibaculum finnmarkense genomovar finnmarkense]MCD8427775.1 hypothetical protein [Tenacibaculum finnmarkense genomovar finnmarkense]MCG8731814.1 hypothetical protein [Tenacibaculum finnmarkense]MCG8751983.1 hypothetical protein [Tenacibaculum finnmarkense]
MNLPDINKRLKEVIEYFNEGNVSDFSKKLNGVSQQKLNRLFNLDSRTKKYPAISQDIITEVLSNIPEVNPTWFLLGKEKMIKDLELPELTEIKFENISDDELSLYIIKNKDRLLTNKVLKVFIEKRATEIAINILKSDIK